MASLRIHSGAENARIHRQPSKYCKGGKIPKPALVKSFESTRKLVVIMAYSNSTGLIVAELTSFTLLVKVLFESVFIFYFFVDHFNPCSTIRKLLHVAITIVLISPTRIILGNRIQIWCPTLGGVLKLIGYETTSSHSVSHTFPTVVRFSRSEWPMLILHYQSNL